MIGVSRSRTQCARAGSLITGKRLSEANWNSGGNGSSVTGTRTTAEAEAVALRTTTATSPHACLTPVLKDAKRTLHLDSECEIVPDRSRAVTSLRRHQDAAVGRCQGGESEAHPLLD